MIKGVTSTGFSYEIPFDAVDNYEFLEVLAESEENFLKFPNMIKMLLGEEQKNRLIEHLKKEKGKASVTEIGKEIQEIFLSNKKTKN